MPHRNSIVISTASAGFRNSSDRFGIFSQRGYFLLRCFLVYTFQRLRFEDWGFQSISNSEKLEMSNTEVDIVVLVAISIACTLLDMISMLLSCWLQLTGTCKWRFEKSMTNSTIDDTYEKTCGRLGASRPSLCLTPGTVLFKQVF